MFETLSLGGLSWTQLGKRVWSEIQEDDVLGRSAQLAYYFLLALFPALLFLVSLLGYFAGEDSEMRESLFRYLSTVLPGEASQLISKTVTDVTEGSGGGKLSFGILATLWAASNGMGAISETLNVAYEVKETRPFWRVRLTAIGLTLALAFLIVSALVLVLYGHDLAEVVAGKFGLGEAFEWAWKILQWPIVLAFVLFAFAIIYYFGPDLHDQDWKWVSPGALLGVALWLLVSFGFKAYLSYFNSYSATYGSLGAVIILMLWFYFTGAAILIGGEINSEIENEKAKQGHPDAKEKGQKAPGGPIDKPKDAADVKPGAKPSNAQPPEDKQTDKSRPAHARAAQPQPHPAPQPQPRAAASSTATVKRTDERRSLSIGKLAVVAGAWALSKLTGKPSRKTTR